MHDKPLTVRIESRCAACAGPICIDVDQDLHWDAAAGGPSPLILEPSVDWSRFSEPSILHAY
ncbi:MAG: hypothetical protein ACM3PC_07885 [Deltaproteobacteria bacterium]